MADIILTPDEGEGKELPVEARPADGGSADAAAEVACRLDPEHVADLKNSEATAPPARPAVEDLLAEVVRLVARLLKPYREAAVRLSEDAHRVGTVEHARMLRNSILAFLYPSGPSAALTAKSRAAP